MTGMVGAAFSVEAAAREGDRPGLRVAVVGAGVSGVVTARVLTRLGLHVTVFEQRDDLGGVWSASRAYPGVATQDDRRTYGFSDAAVESEDEHPSGAAVRAHLERYAAEHGVRDRVRLSTRVDRAEPTPDGWRIHADGPSGRSVEEFDWLVAANGVFSVPFVPDWPGRAAFEAAGGRVVEPGSIGEGGSMDAARVTVVGWGKTAADLAVVAARRGAAVDLVARTLTWKYPKRLGRLTFRHLVLTRAGERLIATPYRSSRTGRVLLRRLPEALPRRALGAVLARMIDRAGRLSALGLRPALTVAASSSLLSDGLLDLVERGRVRVHRDCTVQELGGDQDGPWVRLSNGARLSADVVVAATGYRQQLEFLPPDVLDPALQDGALRLHRRVLALDLPRLAFIGWGHSYRSPLTAEIGAVWLAGALLGALRAPGRRQLRDAARFRLSSGDAHSASGLPAVGLAELDRMLADLGERLPLGVRLRQWVRPVDPADWSPVLRRIEARLAARSRAARS